MTIVNDNSWIFNKLEASLTDDTRVVIYNCHMFIVQATDIMQNDSEHNKSTMTLIMIFSITAICSRALSIKE
jgi:hypothetical protein